ncbi:hypothetical protein J7L68_02950 [bacterium]|nr:hypothetical protein [bacterium]
MNKKKEIIFLCTGNSCRSPMAEGIARKVFADYGLKNYSFASFGTLDIGYSPPSDYARKICRKNNIDISAHRSQQLDSDLANSADTILVMENEHKNWVGEYFGKNILAKTFLITEYGSKNSEYSEIDDPLEQDLNFYENIFNKLYSEIERIAKFELSKSS